jgi:hypothetical protein
MTERERLPDDHAGAEDKPFTGWVEEELREPIVGDKREPLTPEKAERVWWPFVIGLVVVFGLGAAFVYALLISWTAL